MTPSAILAAGLLFGIGIGVIWGFVRWGTIAEQYSLDLDEAEKHIRRLEQDIDFKDFWRGEAERLREQHAGTPYIQPGVRGNEYSAAWIDDQDAA